MPENPDIHVQLLAALGDRIQYDTAPGCGWWLMWSEDQEAYMLLEWKPDEWGRAIEELPAPVAHALIEHAADARLLECGLHIDELGFCVKRRDEHELDVNGQWRSFTAIFRTKAAALLAALEAMRGDRMSDECKRCDR